MEVAPRTCILGAVPNVPDTFCTLTPAERPSNERLMSAMPLIKASLALILSAAPVNIRRSMFDTPVTTTSFKVSLFGDNVIFIVGLGFSVWGRMPM